MREGRTGAKGTGRKAGGTKGRGSARGAAAMPESALGSDPLRDRLLPLDPAAPVVCMVTGEVQGPAGDVEPWTDDIDMLTDAFAWAEARLKRVVAQIDVCARLGVTTEVDEDVRTWEGVSVRPSSIPEVLARAEAQAKVLHREWKGQPQPAEGVGRRALAEDYLFPFSDYDDDELRRDEAQTRLVKLSRLRLWLMRTVQREVLASRRLLERRHATRATGWTPLLDALGDDAELSLLERGVVLVLLGGTLDPGVRRGLKMLDERGIPKGWGDFSVAQVSAFAELGLRGTLQWRSVLSRNGALFRHQLITDPPFCDDDALAFTRGGIGLRTDVLDRFVEACGGG